MRVTSLMPVNDTAAREAHHLRKEGDGHDYRSGYATNPPGMSGPHQLSVAFGTGWDRKRPKVTRDYRPWVSASNKPLGHARDTKNELHGLHGYRNGLHLDCRGGVVGCNAIHFTTSEGERIPRGRAWFANWIA